MSCIFAAARQGSRYCQDETGRGIICCLKMTKVWVDYYMYFGMFTMVWVFLVFAELRAYVIGGTIVQW